MNTYLPRRTASSIDSGSGRPKVSGKNIAKIPTTTAAIPKTIKGKAFDMSPLTSSPY